MPFLDSSRSTYGWIESESIWSCILPAELGATRPGWLMGGKLPSNVWMLRGRAFEWRLPGRDGPNLGTGFCPAQSRAQRQSSRSHEWISAQIQHHVVVVVDCCMHLGLGHRRLHTHSILFKTWFLIRSPVRGLILFHSRTVLSDPSFLISAQFSSQTDVLDMTEDDEEVRWRSWLTQESLVTVCGRWKRTVGALLLAAILSAVDCGCVVAVVWTPAAPGRGGLVAGLQADVDPLEQRVAEEAGQGER